MRLLRDLVGHTLSGRYRLIARLAGGGMGEVYRGHDLLLDRPVAVKVLHPSLAAEESLVVRFKAEARAAARLTHPNVVAVYDWGSEDERTYYMVMEYVSGSDLRDVLSFRVALEPATALHIMAAVADALDAAHATGLVHRDVKPENILIARDGHVKVADFGIAAVADADRALTGDGILGTLRYLSPEQARGNEVTARSDIWAAGAVLGELVTGRPPMSESAGDFLQRRAHEPIPRPSHADPRVPLEIDEVVARACALEPDDRYTSAAQMAADMRAAAYGMGPSEDPADLLADVTGEVGLPDMEPTSFSSRSRRAERGSQKWSRRRVAIAVAAVLLLLVGGRAVGSFMGPDRVTVPKLVGLSMEQAARRTDRAGLKIKIVDRFSSRTVPEGEVLLQAPERGDVRDGATLRLIVSSGAPRMDVPQVTGMTLPVARVRLRAHGMRIAGGVAEKFSLEPAGTVVEQSPSEGRRRWGSRVSVVISKGPQPVEVPDVIKLTASKARETLEAAGFVVTALETYSDDVRAGKVVSIEPAATTVLPQGSDIKMYVSIGPEFEKVTMPDVRNMSLDAARAELESLGLRVKVVQSCPGQTVVDTDPIAGTTVRENDLVALFVC